MEAVTPRRTLVLSVFVVALVACGGDSSESGDSSAGGGSSASGGSGEEGAGTYVPGGVQRTKGDMRMIMMALESRSMDETDYPSTSSIHELAGILAPTYLKGLPTEDAWGNAFSYSGDGEEYKIGSAGQDGKTGTGDDLTVDTGSWTPP
jgi:hypothetical protein